ncbi:MAG: hypothetical protein IPM97_16830 [Bdellovibrionaceae bacterium]|jgi:hypothetical protein|nr:hypothetical protein [Pseudobdellovibrionaceae bacterium]
MDYLAPPLHLITEVKRSIESGASVRSGILVYLQASSEDFSKDVSKWISWQDRGLDVSAIVHGQRSRYRRSLLELLQRGLSGEGIYSYLLLLEEETIEACDDEISRKITKLPFILLVPLLLMQFPAFLLLLFGPLLENFFHSLGSG